MIWLSWRQFRVQAIVGAAIAGVLAIVLVPTGAHLASRYAAAGLTSCHATCGSLAANFVNSVKFSGDGIIFYAGIALLYLAPAFIGMFWGAPLVSREIESGTLRLAWNQSVTRGRWIVVKLAVVGLAAAALTGALSLLVTWWASPVDTALNLGSGGNSLFSFNRMDPLVFAARGVVPLGSAAFAFALGVAIGVLVRRTLPAMAITLVLFAAVQVLVPSVVRPHLLPPATATAPINIGTAGIDIQSDGSGPGVITVMGSISVPGAWILSEHAVRPDGQPFSATAPRACLGSNFQPCNTWLASLHLRERAIYQPASQFWPLQWLELGIYLILAAGLGWLSVWQVRRRRA